MTDAGMDEVAIASFTLDRRQEFESDADERVQHAIAEHKCFHASPAGKRWKLIRKYKWLRVYSDKNFNKTSTVLSDRPPSEVTRSRLQDKRNFVCHGTKRGSLDQFISGNYADTTENLKLSKGILSNNLMDGSIVHVFNTDDDPDVILSSVKWLTYKSPGGGLIPDYDLLIYEKMGQFKGDDGRQYAYNRVKSIDLPNVPSTQTRRMFRISLNVIYLYRQMDLEHVEVFALSETCAVNRHLIGITEYVGSSCIIEQCHGFLVANAKQYAALMDSVSDHLPSSSTSCDLCFSHPKLTKLKACRGCLMQVCRKCRRSRMIFRSVEGTTKPSTAVFCRRCIECVEVVNAMTDTLQSKAIQADYESTVTWQSSSGGVGLNCSRQSTGYSYRSSLSMGSSVSPGHKREKATREKWWGYSESTFDDVMRQRHGRSENSGSVHDASEDGGSCVSEGEYGTINIASLD